VPLEGRVVDTDGEPVEDASVEAVVRGEDTVSATSTDDDGGFSLEVEEPVWLTVTSPEFIERTVAVQPGANPRVVLTQREGTVSMSFGGDTMFGRRFYDENESSGYPWFSIRESEREEDHREILSYVQPLLRSADITSVNLETTLTTSGWRHPSKTYVYTSHPSAATALRDAGIDYVALGNNHSFDALKPGLDDTVRALDDAGMAHSGAGNSSDEAWEPVYFEEQGITVGLISCTTTGLAGEYYDIDWSADVGESRNYTFTQEIDGERESLSFSGGVGVASATEERLAERVEATSETADVTVVQIHGGEEYQRAPTDEVERLTGVASEAGADLVVNHHPHVTGGLERRGETLVAWTLGNFVFDQVLWETFPSYMLTVHVTDDGVKRAYIDPVLLDGYVPKGVVGEPRRSQLRRTASLSSDDFTLTQDGLGYIEGRDVPTSKERRSLSGDGMIFARESGWVSGVVEGADSVELGRDLFSTGMFENHVVGDGYDAPLWRFDRTRGKTGPGVGADESGGVQISRHQSNSSRAILSQPARNFVSEPLTLTGRYKYNSDEGLEILIKWHETAGDTDALDETISSIEGTDGEWRRLQMEIQPPENASYLDIYFRVYPPSPQFPIDLKTERIATFDELRLIEWDDAEGGKNYDHLRIDGSATVEFTSEGTGEEEPEIDWSPLSDSDTNG